MMSEEEKDMAEYRMTAGQREMMMMSNLSKSLLMDYCSAPPSEEEDTSADNSDETDCVTEEQAKKEAERCEPEVALQCLADSDIAKRVSQNFDLFDLASTLENICP